MQVGMMWSINCQRRLRLSKGTSYTSMLCYMHVYRYVRCQESVALQLWLEKLSLEVSIGIVVCTWFKRPHHWATSLFKSYLDTVHLASDLVPCAPSNGHEDTWRKERSACVELHLLQAPAPSLRLGNNCTIASIVKWHHAYSLMAVNE
jgi:hypothetical protein